ncbi:hypothetical protein PI124_g3830 [Phytophthora idaei]|nr:hypothetical protein PI125_g2281 [Phytophthora idaei]KAG3251531.1 hypothetical protein PI124_g3830 [Phytophthora idaei]
MLTLLDENVASIETLPSDSSYNVLEALAPTAPFPS